MDAADDAGSLAAIWLGFLPANLDRNPFENGFRSITRAAFSVNMPTTVDQINLRGYVDASTRVSVGIIIRVSGVRVPPPLPFSNPHGFAFFRINPKKTMKSKPCR